MRTSTMIIAAALWLGAAAEPSQAQIALHAFQPGERARAADVNGNFNNLRTAIEASERRNAELTNRIRDLEAAIATLRELDGALSIETSNGVRTVRLSGVNFQVVNGLNRTESVNGAGNILIGYDEPTSSASADPICSRARAVNGFPASSEAECLAAGGIFGNQHKSGSHNLVMGTQNGYSSFAGVVAGRLNFINDDYASVFGGVDNRASNRFAAILAGQGAFARGANATVLGGIGNQANGRQSTVLGGIGNIASGEHAAIVGGERNEASGEKSSILGGLRNVVSGEHSTISGGGVNTVSGAGSSLLGGGNRTLRADGVTAP